MQTAPQSIYDHPHYYDILFGWDRSAEALFLDALFQIHGLHIGDHLLEVACGTGQVGLKLARFGWTVTGLDLRESMLRFFSAKAEAENLDIKMHCGDMTDFRLDKLADGAFCPVGSF